MAAHIAHHVVTSSSQRYRSQSSSLPASLYEEDELRPCPRPTPAPHPVSSALDFSDPLLCVTPEKPTRRHRYDNAIINANRSLDSSRGSQRVRFDSTVEVKTMSPHETSTETSNIDTNSTVTDNSEDTMELLARANAYALPFGDSSMHSSTSSDSKLSSDSKNSTITVSSCETEDVDFVDVLADDIHSKDYQIYGRKLAKHKKSCIVRTSVWGEDGMGDNVLAKPEFNSTIVLQKQLEGLKVEEIDLEHEVNEKLTSSEGLRNKVNEKAALKVNHPWGYGGLISLDVREEEVIGRVEKEKAGKVKSGKQRTPQEADLIPPPDIMEFFTADLQRESACLSLDIPPADLAPQTADLRHAFDVYRHIRAWEKW